MFDAKTFLSNLTARPGIYKMMDPKGHVLYVGKAKNLKNRVSSYFREQSDVRIKALVKNIAHIEVTVTRNEKEALLLENELIKTLKPRYNIDLRDDKSYPYLFLSNHLYPRLVFHRGLQKQKGQYFGPYPSAYAVKETLNLLQRLFKIRQCDDPFFKSRTRPCLQYQIERCTGPCCDLITPEQYALDVKHAQMFLNGQHQRILKELIDQMNEASYELAYEKASVFRDQITSLQKIIENQAIYSKEGDVDVIAFDMSGEQVVFYLLFIRQGKMSGSKSFYPKIGKFLTKDEMLSSFLSRYYLGVSKRQSWPQEIIVPFKISDVSLIEEALFDHAERKIKIKWDVRSQKRRWQMLCEENASIALKQRLGTKKVYFRRLQALKNSLGLSDVRRIECFDVSHTFGEATVASCVVFDEQGSKKEDYRQYNIETTKPDDYGAMRDVLMRRYKKAKEQDLVLPELILIDGGKGQLGILKSVLKECQILDVMLVGVAKGKQRKPGLETLYVIHHLNGEDVNIVTLPPTSEGLHLIQQIRDEAHRFAITRHRAKRGKARTKSPLEAIPGIGPKRRQAILTYFGGLTNLMSASEEAIAQVPGFSKKLAKEIYRQLHET